MHNENGKNQTITSDKLILVEGKDEFYFVREMLRNYEIHNVDIICFDGSNNGGLSKIIDFFTKIQQIKWNNLKCLIVFRDAEKDYQASIQSIKATFKKYNLPVPNDNLEYSFNNGHTLKTSFIIIRDFDDKGILKNSGCLEDLCVKIIYDDKNLITCTDKYLDEVEKNYNHKLMRRHKARLHAYFALHEKARGREIFQAVENNIFNWNSPYLENIKKLLQEI